MTERAKIQLLIIAYIIVVLFGYNNFVSKATFLHWNYDLWTVFLFCCISLLPSFWMPVETLRPSSLVYWVLYLVVYIPAIIVPYLSIRISFDDLIFFNLSMLVAFMICLKMHLLSLISFSYFKIKKELFYFGFFAIYGFFSVLLIRSFGFNLSFVSLEDVYNVRETFNDKLDGESTFYIRWLLYVLNPFLIVMGYLFKTRRWMLLLGFIGEFFIYSTSGLKSSLFIGFAIIAILFCMKKFSLINKLAKLILSSLILLLVISMCIDSYFFNSANKSQNMVTSLTLRRNIVLPGYLSGEYYKFFSNNPKAYMANNKYFGILVNYESSYEESSAPRIIGKRLYGTESVNANANIWADAYANYGVVGMLLTSVVLGLYLRIYDSFANGIEPKLSFIMLTGPAFFFSNSALLTAFIGHGALAALLLIYMYKSMLLTKQL